MQQIEEQFGKGSLTRLGGANAGHADKPLPDRPPDAVKLDAAMTAGGDHPLPNEMMLALKRIFGFERFRPGQEAVVRDALAGRDGLAILPTGGGKSLCFQLPALLRPGVTLVVSPLIALMQDQVRLLQESGIAATFINSSLEPAELGRRITALLRSASDSAPRSRLNS